MSSRSLHSRVIQSWLYSTAETNEERRNAMDELIELHRQEIGEVQ